MPRARTAGSYVKFVRESGEPSVDGGSYDGSYDKCAGSPPSGGDSSDDDGSVDDGSYDKCSGGPSSEDDCSGDGRLNGWASVFLSKELAISLLLISSLRSVLQHIIIEANDIWLAID